MMQEYKFFTALKQFILKLNDNETKMEMAKFYESLYQLKVDASFNQMIQDCENHKFKIMLDLAEDDCSYWQFGSLYIYFDDYTVKRSYNIELEHDHQSLGYCKCNPNMENYNPIHKCCGKHCDTTFPKVRVEQVNVLALHSYEGYEKDLWNDLEKWKDTYEQENEDKVRLEQIEKLKEKINTLHKELELLENYGK